MAMNLVKKVAVTASTTAYSAGDCLGGLLTATLNGRISGDSDQVLQSIEVTDKAGNQMPMNVIFFQENPDNSTFTDNAALNIDDSDLNKAIGAVVIVADDYLAFSANSAAFKNNIGLPLNSKTGNLYFVIQANGAATYAADSITITLNFL